VADGIGAALDFFAGGSTPRTPEQIKADSLTAQENARLAAAAAPPVPEPPPPGQMPKAEDALPRKMEQEAIAKAVAAMQAALDQSQEGKDRESRDRTRDDEDERGHERTR
jgi:hypothetical protein